MVLVDLLVWMELLRVIFMLNNYGMCQVGWGNEEFGVKVLGFFLRIFILECLLIELFFGIENVCIDG